MTDKQYQTIFQKAYESLKSLFFNLGERISTPNRPPELWELEACFTKDTEADPEKVRNRQFSNSIRSGRG